MRSSRRAAWACIIVACLTQSAFAQEQTPGDPGDPYDGPAPQPTPEDPATADPYATPDPTATPDPYAMPTPMPAGSAGEADLPEGKQGPKQPKRGDFDAGGQVRLPSGPDEMGEFATFNWVAVDAKGRYFLLDSVSANLSIPIALIKPDQLGPGIEPRTLGGFMLTLDAKLPKYGPQPKYKYDAGLVLSGGFMREGAMLLSEKDYPLFLGDFKAGFNAGLLMKLKLSSLVDFSLLPLYVYQDGTDEAADGLQIPMSLILGLGELVKVSADLGVYTGDDFSFSGDDGGRISLGGALDVKLGKIIVHAGAGVASLLSGGLYPSVSESLYIDLNVKFAK